MLTKTTPMGYNKSPFKMAPKSPMMKALKGNQHRLPEHLKEAIKAAPEDSPAKSYGSKKNAPLKKTTNNGGKEYKPVSLSDRRHLADAYKQAKITVKDGVASGRGSRSTIDPKTGLPTDKKLLAQINRASSRINESRKRTHDLKVGNKAVDPQEKSKRVIGREARREQENINRVRTGRESLATVSAREDKIKKTQVAKSPPLKKRGVKNLKGSPVKSVESANKQARLKKRANKLSDKAMNFPGNKPVSDKRAGKLLDRSRKLKEKARKLRNKA